jgi:hypothetical protein
LLEILVHLEVDPEDLPASFQLLAADIPDRADFDRIPENELARGWREHAKLGRPLAGGEARPAPASAIGDRARFGSIGCSIRPIADASSVRIAKTIRPAFDSRLFRTA